VVDSCEKGNENLTFKKLGGGGILEKLKNY
jgi:hypothetical protein